MKVTSTDNIYSQLARFIDDTASLLQDYSLERIRKLMDYLDNPQDKINVIHIAGTSGKTSTCYYLAEMFRLSGLKVGLSVSPEIDTIAERSQINGKLLPEKIFCDYLNEFLTLVEDSCIRTSYWELMTAFSFWVFAEKEQVEIAVIETGLGGLLDASNIVNNASKICVITDIGFDHQAVLGNTITEIAAQKAGIIQDNNQVVMYSQGHEVDGVIRARVDEVGGSLSLLNATQILNEAPGYVSTLPGFQARNWCLACETYKKSMKHLNLPSLNREQLAESVSLYIPARMDVRKIKGKTVLMDGAHNGQKMTALVNSFLIKYQDVTLPVILALKDDKDSDEVLKTLQPIVSRLILTEFVESNDLMKSSINAKKLAATAKNLGYQDVQIVKNPHLALEEGLRDEAEMLLVTGSFYLIGQLRKRLSR